MGTSGWIERESLDSGGKFGWRYSHFAHKGFGKGDESFDRRGNAVRCMAADSLSLHVICHIAASASRAGCVQASKFK